MSATATIVSAQFPGRVLGGGGMTDGSQSQYMRALQRANEVRMARAALKRSVATGNLSAAAVISDCPSEAASMAVGDLLTSQRRWGQTRSRKLLAQVPLSERKTIGSLTERQRRILTGLLEPAGVAGSAAEPCP